MLGESLNYDQVDIDPGFVVVWRPRSSGAWRIMGPPPSRMDIDPAVASGACRAGVTRWDPSPGRGASTSGPGVGTPSVSAMLGCQHLATPPHRDTSVHRPPLWSTRPDAVTLTHAVTG